MTVAQFVADFFARKKCTDVFTVTGGGAMFLNDALSRHNKLKAHCFHHEQACAIAAESYFKVTQHPAIVNVTTGPGATNAITGVYGAFVDSSAMIVISGQVKRPTMRRFFSPDLRQLGDQEVDIVPMVTSITKYAALLDRPEHIEYELEKAFHLAMSGRPGPVWLDIPIDVQSMKLPLQKKQFRPTVRKMAPKSRDIKTLLEQLSQSKRPVIICGTGIHGSNTSSSVSRLASRLDIPVVSSFCASDVLPSESPHFIGRQGTIGDRAGNFAVQNADLVLILGARMNIRQVSYAWKNFATHAFKVMVDIDIAEMNKPTLAIDLRIHSDLRIFFDVLNQAGFAGIPKKSAYLKWCQERKQKYPAADQPKYESKKLNPYSFVKEVSRLIPENSVIVTADGAAAITTFQTFDTKKGQRLFSNSGSAPMGYDLPAAIGAAIAVSRPGNKTRRKTICFAGDGSIMMNLQELQTIRTKNLDVIIIILNNGGYLSILQTQKNYFKDNIFGCVNSPELSFPSFENLSHAFGIPYCQVNTLEEVSKITEMLSPHGPFICEAILDEGQYFEPKLVSRQLADGSFVSPELDDMYPFLTEQELKQNRIAPKETL
jgi:acetolactate synthase-1/2/3 large subunit